MAFVYTLRLEVVRGLEISGRCLELAERNQNREMLPAIHYLLALGTHLSGDLLQAASRFSELLKRLRSAHQLGLADLLPANPWATIPSNLALVQQQLGRPDEALRLSNEALSRARQIKHSFTLGLVMQQAASLRLSRREPEAVRELAEAVVALAEEHGFRELLARGHALRGWAMTELGQTEQGSTELKAADVFHRMLVAEVYARTGRADLALTMLDEQLASVERSGARGQEPDLYRRKGEATLGRDPSAAAEAEACFRKAIEIAKAQSAKWFELRATTSLARLLRSTGRRDEARAMLAEIYNWFTEGFDTADLKDAKALLEELSA